MLKIVPTLKNNQSAAIFKNELVIIPRVPANKIRSNY